ncbi:hypothetical protein V8Z74_15150 [Comamonas sp. w2-DMI]|uniref:hypothetical protein n=1 Tax=Comamonas sp. w2-DMI TaxID=3126391 RepID=UPI0032E48170
MTTSDHRAKAFHFMQAALLLFAELDAESVDFDFEEGALVLSGKGINHCDVNAINTCIKMRGNDGHIKMGQILKNLFNGYEVSLNSRGLTVCTLTANSHHLATFTYAEASEAETLKIRALGIGRRIGVESFAMAGIGLQIPLHIYSARTWQPIQNCQLLQAILRMRENRTVTVDEDFPILWQSLFRGGEHVFLNGVYMGLRKVSSSSTVVLTFTKNSMLPEDLTPA